MSPPSRSVTVDGAVLRRGSRVRLRPRQRADIFDMALAGRTAEVAAVEEDLEGRIHVSVTLDGDPGRDLGSGAQIAHRFFFSPEELEPLGDTDDRTADARVLVAGIGNIFLGDDAFGPEVAAALLARPHPPGVHIADFGIRGMDLAYALGHGYDAAVLVDAAPRGQGPGTLYVIEPEEPAGEPAPEAHGMDPVRVLALARHLNGKLPRTLIVGCEPQSCPTGEEAEVGSGFSTPVRHAVARAVDLVESVVDDLLAEARAERDSGVGSPGR
ncbi:hydrogenase maturation protease [Streptomyces sp. NPDC002896]|uniref:hydrogenase maturation protease n=1 Tax=Streptomyces sp. NPDC002896 TaxID=3154438 RepID=UPI003320AB93